MSYVTRSQVDVETAKLMLKQIQSHTSIHWWGEQLKRLFLGLSCWLITICNNKKAI